jgi:hypothetical protein
MLDEIGTTISCPFKLAIVGGGPAGCSILVRAMRTGLMEQLCGAEYNALSDVESNSEKSPVPPRLVGGGVCLVEQGGADSLGCGNLRSYAINSNTKASKFLSHVLDEKPDSIPSESVKGTPLENLLSAASTAQLRSYGSSICPLKSVGMVSE